MKDDSYFDNDLNQKKKFLSDLDKSRKIIIDCSEKSKAFPKRIINPFKFYQEYTDFIEEKCKEINRLNSINKYDQGEFRLIRLFHNLFMAKDKFNNYQQSINCNLNYEEKSQFEIINDIIKSSYDLTSYIYLMKYLQNFFCLTSLINKNFPEISNGTLQYDNFFKQNKVFSFDLLNNSNNDLHNKLLKNIFINIKKGEIAYSQDLAASNNEEFLSAILNGGLPIIDISLIKDNVKNIDTDLFPIYMNNLDFQNYLQICRGNNIQGQEKEILGNQNWILWLETLYYCSKKSANSNSQFNDITDFLSGNYKKHIISSDNIYEYLFMNIMNLFNSTLLEKLKNVNYVNYHYEADLTDDIDRLINERDGLKIEDIIGNIRNNKEYNNIIKNYPTIDLEFRIIELHFKYQNNKNDFLDFYINHLLNLLTEFEKNNCVYCDKKENLASIKIYKIIYISLICIYQNYQDCLNENENLKQLHDNFIFEFIKNLINETSDSNQIVYLTLYMYDIEIIKQSLAYFANSIQAINIKYDQDINDNQIFQESNYANKSNNEYEIFIKLVKEYYGENIYELQEINKYIADTTNIFHFDNKNSIDNTLNEYINIKKNNLNINISNENQQKINQILYLFGNKNTTETSTKYLFKLLLKFIANYYFNEANELFDKLKENNIINLNFDFDNFLTNLSQFIIKSYKNNINIDYSYAKEIFYSFMYAILQCFNSYLDIELNKDKCTKHDLQKICIDLITNKFLKLNEIIQKIISCSFLIKYFNDYVYENNNNDFKKIISDWGYQLIKWIADIYEKGYINDNKGISFINNCMLYNEIGMFKDYYLLREPYNIHSDMDFVIEEMQLFDYINIFHYDDLLNQIYRISKISHIYLNEIMDITTKKDLQKDIDELDF